MQQWENYRKTEEVVIEQKRRKDAEAISCPVCSSQWFEEVTVSRFKADHFIAPGMKVPPSGAQFTLLKCIRCKDFLEPRMSVTPQEYASTGYASLLDTADGKGDTRKKDESKG